MNHEKMGKKKTSHLTITLEEQLNLKKKIIALRHCYFLQLFNLPQLLLCSVYLAFVYVLCGMYRLTYHLNFTANLSIFYSIK